jgi:hypothetical protein
MREKEKGGVSDAYGFRPFGVCVVCRRRGKKQKKKRSRFLLFQAYNKHGVLEKKLEGWTPLLFLALPSQPLMSILLASFAETT